VGILSLTLSNRSAELKKMENSHSTFNSNGGIVAQIRRAPIGVVLCSGPFNYPFNETYTTFIPAIIMGNAVIMKLPVSLMFPYCCLAFMIHSLPDSATVCFAIAPLLISSAIAFPLAS